MSAVVTAIDRALWAEILARTTAYYGLSFDPFGRAYSHDSKLGAPRRLAIYLARVELEMRVDTVCALAPCYRTSVERGVPKVEDQRDYRMFDELIDQWAAELRQIRSINLALQPREAVPGPTGLAPLLIRPTPRSEPSHEFA